MKKLFLLLLTIFSFIGCSPNDESIYDYVGTWSGTYEGSDKGVWNFVVASDGKVTGTMHSENNKENYHISGYLNNSGQLNAQLVLPNDGQFNGSLNKEGLGNGNWVNQSPDPNIAGSWKGEKDKK